MDYSLIFIIIEVLKVTDKDYQKIWETFGEVRYHCKLVNSKNQKYIYCFGIIDYLQIFNYKKFIEINLRIYLIETRLERFLQ